LGVDNATSFPQVIGHQGASLTQRKPMNAFESEGTWALRTTDEMP
jgi:hypothetical protein